MLGPNVKYPCIAYTEEEKRGRICFFYYVEESRRKYFRFWRWPPADWYLPGGILDSGGQQFRIISLVGWEQRPTWLFGILDELAGGFIFRLLHGREFRLELSQPIALSLPDFKQKFSEMAYGVQPRNEVQLADFMRTKDRLDSCKSFEEVVRFADWFQKTDGGTVVAKE